ncbi:PREDICTED: histidine-rich glycoprotein-like [Dufourea novaeangliae]|uniref:histidine-rich glycoprotein-like n=1 Tax=Dufourea novaeangliae TaxID=178035 RepID=UPI0007672ECB|nr:PREDICTED: histidine-rich glycoprotein-like [Dufourea novaeangliae]
MGSEVLRWILLTVSVHAVVNAAFTHGPTGLAGKIRRTVWKDKDGNDNGDYKVNAGFPSAYGVKKQRAGDGYHRGNYKDGEGGDIRSKFNTLGPNLSQEKHDYDYYYDSNYGNHGSGPGQADKGKSSGSDDYNHDYKHGYRHSHGYRSQHRHSNNGKDGDDGYHGYHRVRFEHDQDNDGKGVSDHGVNHDGWKHGGYHYDDGFEFHYGDSGKDGDDSFNEDTGHGGYSDDYKQNSEQSLSQDHNEGVDDHGPDYHYAYSQSSGSYGKHYPSFASGHHYHHHGQDHNHGAHR